MILALIYFELMVSGILVTAGVTGASITETINGEAKVSKGEGTTEETLISGTGSGGNVSGPATQNEKAWIGEFHKLTGLNEKVILRWMRKEQPPGQTVEGGNNWLNVETGGPGGGSGPYGATAKWVETLSPIEAAHYTYEWIKKNTPGILQAAGKGEAAEVGAIESSGWAGVGKQYTI